MCMYAFAIATVVALFAPSVPALSQAVEFAPVGPDEVPFQGRSVAQPDVCVRLQEACFDEDELGDKAKAIASVFATRAPTSARCRSLARLLRFATPTGLEPWKPPKRYLAFAGAAPAKTPVVHGRRSPGSGSSPDQGLFAVIPSALPLLRPRRVGPIPRQPFINASGGILSKF
jgi:hypothetical protein